MRYSLHSSKKTCEFRAQGFRLGLRDQGLLMRQSLYTTSYSLHSSKKTCELSPSNAIGSLRR